MNRHGRLTFFAALAALLVFVAVGCSKKKSGSTEPGGPATTATVSGTVQNVAGGSALQGASVAASSGATATTDALGHFSVSVPANQAVRIDITKAGFSLNQLVVQLAGGALKTCSVGLMAAGTTTSVTTSAGGTVTDAASSAVLKLPANFVTASGAVNVTVTGLDPTSDQIKALPGGLDALDAGGNPVYLQPVSFAEYTVKDGSGNVLQFNPSASQGADIELPIPATLQGQPGYQNGDAIECYVYDPADGKWKTPVSGLVGPSSVNGSVSAIKATIFHLSWYGGAPASSQIACVEGTVTLSGAPAANVDVEAFPGGNTRTDAAGHYQVQAAVNSTVRVIATQAVGTLFRSAEGSVAVGASGGGCAHLDLALGNAQTGQYEVTAFMTQSGVGVTTFDLATAYLTVGVSASQIPVNGAVVQLKTGSTTTFTLAAQGSGSYGIYTGQQSFSLVGGQTYTIRVDFDADGTFDATGSVKMAGRPVITSPANNATVGKSFTETWNDPVSGAGYTPVYLGLVSGDTRDDVFLTTAKTKVVGDGIVDAYGLKIDPLEAGAYELSVLGTFGPIFEYVTLSTPPVPNITGLGGADATGFFWGISQSDPVNVTSTGVVATRSSRAPQAAASRRALELVDRLHRLTERLKSAAGARAMATGR